MDNSDKKSALLVMDVQPGIIDRLDDKKDYLSRLQAAIDEARKRNVYVVYVVVGFRKGFPEVSESNKSFSTLKQNNSTQMVDPKPTISVGENEPVVIKRRVSAFTGSDLEVLLRGLGIRHIILTGIATSGVVLSTLREAADKDYQITVLKDLCADFDSEVHEVLTEKVFPRQADVVDSKIWLKTK